MRRYKIILADPPWAYTDKAAAGKRGASFKYSVMSLPDIKALDVQSIAADDCALFLWTTWPFMAEALEVITAWGFKYRTIGFLWAKTNKSGHGLFWGMGNWTRSNSEPCLLAVRGKPERLSASVHSVVLAPVQGHSKKPKHVHRRIVTLLGDQPRIELFARDRYAGWDIWGNEVESDVKLISCPARESKLVPAGQKGTSVAQAAAKSKARSHESPPASPAQSSLSVSPDLAQ